MAMEGTYMPRLAARVGLDQTVKAGNKWGMMFQNRSLTPFRSLLRHLPLLGLASLLALTGCQTAPRPGAFERRTGDEIVVAGQLVHTGTRVVLWLDPGGYDAYRVERRFSPFEDSGWETSHEQVAELKSPN